MLSTPASVMLSTVTGSHIHQEENETPQSDRIRLTHDPHHVHHGLHRMVSPYRRYFPEDWTIDSVCLLTRPHTPGWGGCRFHDPSSFHVLRLRQAAIAETIKQLLARLVYCLCVKTIGRGSDGRRRRDFGAVLDLHCSGLTWVASPRDSSFEICDDSLK